MNNIEIKWTEKAPTKKINRQLRISAAILKQYIYEEEFGVGSDGLMTKKIFYFDLLYENGFRMRIEIHDAAEAARIKKTLDDVFPTMLN